MSCLLPSHYKQFALIAVFINGNNGTAFRQTGHSDFAVITNFFPFIVKSADLYALYPYNYST
jgi:hypothetical protein